MRVLFATDGSEGGQAAARLLAGLILPLECQLNILSVATGDDESPAQAALDAARDALSHTTASLSATVRHGHAAKEIVQAAEEHPTTLLVLGSHGHSAIHRFLLGSVAERVARHSPCPVLLARPLEGEIKRVLVAVDSSPSAQHAGNWVRDHLASLLPPQTQVCLMTVLPLLEILMREHVRVLPPLADHATTLDRLQREQAQEILDGLAEEYSAAGLRPTTTIRSGDPALTILNVAEEDGADLVVTGAHGATLLDRFYPGSVSDTVLRQAKCSVLIVR